MLRCCNLRSIWVIYLLSLRLSLESLVFRDTNSWVVEFPKASQWHWRQSLCNQGDLWFWLRAYRARKTRSKPRLSSPVSRNRTKWADIAPSKAEKKPVNTNILLLNASCICLCFPVSYALPLIAFPCENVYSASHSSQPPHSLIKMAF